MFEQRGREAGQCDGHADAALGLPARPRPDLVMAVAFTGYRDGYLKAYADAHRARRLQEERRRAEELSRFAKPAEPCKRSPSEIDRAFDRGWQDGFAGQLLKPPRPADQAEAYRNGHRIGTRDRGYARARELRAGKTRNHSRDR